MAIAASTAFNIKCTPPRLKAFMFVTHSAVLEGSLYSRIADRTTTGPVAEGYVLSFPIKLQKTIAPNGKKTACSSAALISFRMFLDMRQKVTSSL